MPGPGSPCGIRPGFLPVADGRLPVFVPESGHFSEQIKRAIPHCASVWRTSSSEGRESVLKPKPQMSNNGPAAQSSAPLVSSQKAVAACRTSSNIGLSSTSSPRLNRLSCDALLYPERVVSISYRISSICFCISAGLVFTPARLAFTPHLPPCAYPPNWTYPRCEHEIAEISSVIMQKNLGT